MLMPVMHIRHVVVLVRERVVDVRMRVRLTHRSLVYVLVVLVVGVQMVVFERVVRVAMSMAGS